MYFLKQFSCDASSLVNLDDFISFSYKNKEDDNPIKKEGKFYI